MRTRFAVFLTLIGAGFFWIALASTEVPKFGHASFGGSGCPQGSGKIETSSDGQVVHFKLSPISVEAGGAAENGGRRIARKNCDVSIPIQVPEGYRVALPAVAINGTSHLPAGAYAEVNTETFYSGTRGARDTKRLEGPIRTKFVAQAIPTDPMLAWSPCGVDFNLRVNMSLRVGATSRQRAEAALNTIDLGLNQLRWVRCN